MKLVELLASGVRGAENGHAEFYQRGSTTRVTWYSDFEAGAASDGNLTLDANGGGVAYVDGLTTVKVYDSDGALLRTVVAGANAGATETKGQSFTGTDYGKALSSANKPVTLQTVLNRWLTSAGTTDWNVLVSGADKTLQAAIGAVSGIVYNVKASEYGALGDGASNDEPAIQAAIDAAEAAGGGWVFFPPGDYLTGARMEVPDTVSLIGSGAHRCSLRPNNAGVTTLRLQGGGGAVDTVIAGLSFGSNVANSSTVVELTNNNYAPGRIVIDRCWFGSSGDGGDDLSGSYVGIAAGTSNTRVLVRDCEFHMSATAQKAVDMGSTTNREATVESCTFKSNITNYAGTLIDGEAINVTGCRFDTSNVVGTTHTAIQIARGIVVGNFFADPSSGTLRCIRAQTWALETGDVIVEAGNVFGTDFNKTRPFTVGHATRAESFLKSSKYWLEVTDNSASVTLPTSQFGYIELKRTASGAQTINAENDSGSESGASLYLVLENTSGLAITFTWGSGFVTANATEVVADGDIAVCHFVGNGGTSFREVSISNYT